MTETKAALQSYFEDGDIPTGENFASLIDSFALVWVAADATARSALSEMVAGDFCYQQDTGVYYVFNGSVWVAVGAGIGGSTGSTDNAMLRADGTGGATIQSSGVIVGDNGDIDGARSIIPHLRIGATGAPTASAVLDLLSTDGAVLLPRMTTTQRNALTPADGMLIYNTTVPVLQYYLNGTWTNVGVEGGGGPPTGAAGGDLSGTYPNPSVVDDSHNHTGATVSLGAAGGALGGTYPNPTLESLSHALGSALALARGQAML